jgi:hypothetical protein
MESIDAYRAWCRQHGFRVDTRKNWHEQRQERTLWERLQAETAADDSLARHASSLGFPDVAAYREWCRRAGFGETTRKTARQQRQERDERDRQRAAEALAGSRRRTRRPDETIRLLHAGGSPGEELRTPYLARIQELFAGTPEPGERDAFLRLLLCAQERADLFGLDPVIEHLGPLEGNTFLEALRALAGHHGGWMREPERWRPESRSSRRQFSSLARHLLARYAVPVFMDAAWFHAPGPEALRRQDWFRHLGVGRNLRTADIPLRMTKMMAHRALEAPDDFPIEHALRWGQVLGMDGTGALARAVLATRLGEAFEDEPFWETVLRFFVNNPMLDPECVGPIVDYLHHLRHVPQERPEGDPAPLDPSFSMKGRTVDSMLRRVEEWHAQLARSTRQPAQEWGPSGFQEELSPDLGCWRVVELRTAHQLYAEGRQMNHCVGSYARSCAKGTISVWSVQYHNGQSRDGKRVLTVAVQNAGRRISQVRGKNNASPLVRGKDLLLQEAYHALRFWAEREGLRLARHL